MITVHDVNRWWRAATGAVVVSLAILQGACKEEPPKVPVWRFQCPDQWVLIREADTTGGRDSTLDSITSIPLSGPITNIPEYHDCQRFIDQGVYGSVYAIFAAFRLDTVSGEADASIPFATIYTPDGTYGTLGIEPGFNCLVLSKTGVSWSATMVPRGQGNDKSDCSGHPTSSDQKLLEVRPQPVHTSTALESSDFPAAARWDWDSVNGKQYIGIRCGSAWCEIGAPGFSPSPAYDGDLAFDPIPGVTPTRRANIRVERIKGWYDEQQLADTGEPARPGPVHGLLFPNPALDTISWPLDDTPDHAFALSFYTNQWIHVAYALVDAPYDKWHFTKGAINERYGRNKIYLCYGTPQVKSCNVPSLIPKENPHSLAVTSCKDDPNHPGMHWWAKTVNAKGSISIGCVRRRDHSTELAALRNANSRVRYGIPGTARWKFLQNDESTWVSCPTGCCTKQ